MKRSISFLIFCVLMVLALSCTKEGGVQNGEIEYSTDNEHIKSVSAGGTINHQYLYDRAGKIVEENCLFYFKRYLYDENERLVKVESAFDESMLSSSSFVERRTEFMTSKNSDVKSYSLYEYDHEGLLSKIKNYANITGKEFEYRSMQTFEYDGALIAKVNLHDPTGQITQYHVYTYDDYGNVANEKYYSNNVSPNELISETSYKYDNYKNPYRILSILGSPGLFMNINNIIETNLIRHYEVQGFEKYSTSKNTYQYNKNGYPVKVNENGNEFEYHY